MHSQTSEEKLAYFNGYLDAFSVLNNKCNHGAYFVMSKFEYKTDLNLDENVARFFPSRYKLALNKLDENWTQEIKKVFDYYFYEFIDRASPILNLSKFNLKMKNS